MEIDLNADIAEGCPSDEELLPYLTSVNICCAGHAGSPLLALKMMTLAQKYGLQIGIHPGYLDRDNFGRIELNLPLEQIRAELLFQIGGMVALAQSQGVILHHLKPHGALYHRLTYDEELAEMMIQVANTFNLGLVGLPESALQKRAKNRCLFIAEGFADRGYAPSGQLIPRNQPGAIIHDPDIALAQIQHLIKQFAVRTICIHSDTPNIVSFLKSLHSKLLENGIAVAPYSPLSNALNQK